MSDFHYKVHRRGDETLLAICDASLNGKTLAGDVEIIVDADFYGTETCKDDEAVKLAEEATMINCLGNDVVALFQKRGLVDKDAVILLAGIKHAQRYVL